MNWFLLLPIFLGGLTAYVAVRWIYFKILKVAFEKRLVDNEIGFVSPVRRYEASTVVSFFHRSKKISTTYNNIINDV